MTVHLFVKSADVPNTLITLSQYMKGIILFAMYALTVRKIPTAYSAAETAEIIIFQAADGDIIMTNPSATAAPIIMGSAMNEGTRF